MSGTKKKEKKNIQVGFMDSAKSYFKGVKSEWGKITWPERRQVVFETILVLIVVIFFTVVVYSLDKFYLFIVFVLQHFNVIPKVG